MKQFCKDIKKYAYFSAYLAKIDLKAEVANSYLNWIWWVLEPLLNMLVYYFIFKDLLGNTEENFIVFIYSGLIMWNFFNKVVLYSIKLVRSNKEIVTKVYVPKFVLLISNMLLNGFKWALSALILIGLMMASKIPISINILYIIPVYITLFVFIFGCGSVFLHLGVFIDDLAYAISILLNMLFFLSGVFYDLKAVIQPPLGDILITWNPLAMMISAMRDCLLYSKAPNLVHLGLWFIVSLILCIIGISKIYKYENTYVKII